MVVAVVTVWRAILLSRVLVGEDTNAANATRSKRRNPLPLLASSSSTIFSLRAGGYDLNNNASTSRRSSSSVLRPLHPTTNANSNYNNNINYKGTLVHKTHWNERIQHLRESIWDTQKSLGMALFHLRKRSLELEENQTDSDVSFDYDDDDDDDDMDDEEHNPDGFRSIASLTTGTTATTQSSQDFSPFLEYSNTLPLDEWGFCAISSLLSLVTCMYVYSMVSRNLHWDWSMNDYNTFYTSYSILEWCWRVAPDLLCITAGTIGMLSGLYATCIFSVLAFHGHSLANQHQLNNPLYQYRSQALVENFLRRTSHVRHRAFQSFRLSLYSLGLQIPLLITFRLPSWVQLRVVIMGVVALIVVTTFWDAQSILVNPAALSSSSEITTTSITANQTVIETQEIED